MKYLDILSVITIVSFIGLMVFFVIDGIFYKLAKYPERSKYLYHFYGGFKAYFTYGPNKKQ